MLYLHAAWAQEEQPMQVRRRPLITAVYVQGNLGFNFNGGKQAGYALHIGIWDRYGLQIGNDGRWLATTQLPSDYKADANFWGMTPVLRDRYRTQYIRACWTPYLTRNRGLQANIQTGPALFTLFEQAFRPSRGIPGQRSPRANYDNERFRESVVPAWSAYIGFNSFRNQFSGFSLGCTAIVSTTKSFYGLQFGWLLGMTRTKTRLAPRQEVVPNP
ncbi:hypothetical protein DBR32_06720 [Taibaiella sp. KBW10]|nr:hypothetical protein DBR32_06720 [Taibaiella sp. KBW10]